MALPFDGPSRLLDTIRIIAKDRTVLVSEIKSQYNPSIGISGLPENEPVPDTVLDEMVELLKRSGPLLYEKNKRLLDGIKVLPKDWKARLIKQKQKEEKEKQARNAKLHEQWVKRQAATNEMVNPIFSRLLDIGTRKAFDEIKDVPGAGSFEGVTKIVHEFEFIRHYCESLKQNQRAAFIKAVAAYESSIDATPHEGSRMGPMGSTTSLQLLIPMLSKKYHDSVLDWVLRNTRSYRYFIAAPNIKVWREVERAYKERRENEKRKRREKSIELENKRKGEIAKRKATAATINLPKAISCNNLDLAHALLKKGARIRKADKVGLLSLAGYARTIGKNEVAEDIEESIRKMPKGLFDD